MTTWGLIREIVQKGFTFEAGQHCDGNRGYWAGFFVYDPKEPECDVCDKCGEETPTIHYWKDAGHAMTLHRAVIMAAKIALGKPVVVPGSGEFKL
jgi:hypothetical protein